MTFSKRPDLPKSFDNFVNEKKKPTPEEPPKKEPINLWINVDVLEEMDRQRTRSGIDRTNWIRAAIREKLDRDERK